MTIPVRFPDAASLESPAGLGPASADADLVPALACTFPGFEFSMARIDDDYWRDTHSVIRPGGARLGELRQLAKENGDVDAFWRCLKETDLQIIEWRGASVFVFRADRSRRRRLYPDRTRPREPAAGRPDRQSG